MHKQGNRHIGVNSGNGGNGGSAEGNGSGDNRPPRQTGRQGKAGKNAPSHSLPSAPASRTAPHRRRSSSRSSRTPSASPAFKALVAALALGWLAYMGWGLWSRQLPLWSAAALLALNLLTLWTYAADKKAACAGTRRTSENQLHLLSLLGGWPAAWVAQQILRHKTSKTSFQIVYWLTIALHFTAMFLWWWLQLWRRHDLL